MKKSRRKGENQCNIIIGKGMNKKKRMNNKSQRTNERKRTNEREIR